MSLFALSHIMPVQPAGLYPAAFEQARPPGTPAFSATLEALEQADAPLSLTEAFASPQTPAQEKPTASRPVEAAARSSQLEEVAHGPEQDESFGFWDFVDLINPLQHLPLIGTLYREATGDSIKPEVQVAGSILLGVATGSVVLSAASAVASALLEQENGKEPTLMLAEALWGEEEETIDLEPDGEEKIMLAEVSSQDMAAMTDLLPLPDLDAAPIAPVLVAQAQPAEPVRSQTNEATAAQTPQDLLAALLSEQEQAHKNGKSIPPQLVQDFMFMAMDRYEMAARLESGATQSR